MLGFAVLLVSGLLLIFLGWEILASPYVLTVASLIPLGISLGIANQYFPQWKKPYAWFALLGIIAIRELTKATRELVNTSMQIFELFFVCALLYLILTFTFSMFLQYLERRVLTK